ncbi:ArnT family glycosyltransferase [Sphingobium ummariense]|uniref:Glycosyltransferase RgtA/B/C/D-like domain-containing protein n=1 Tax=Sphingobium ummariense RL-3 TaxID=1346791 RepID=T0KFV8_9SPHN|nr:glycosyltransferase family 39 protein [Sphingobium ummariense]EQB32318.1 hypothetical protein M529_10035 [Sphingobium ummariense RL-3]
MYPQAALAPVRRLAVPAVTLVPLVLALWLCLAALATPFDHDESQYVAGAYFSSRLLIFRDFLYLQPPLHSWTFAPLAWLFPGHIVIAMRLATAVTAICALAALWTTQRAAAISRESATVSTLLVAATAAFQFCGSVVRNDMLPTLLVSMAMLVLILALRHCRPRFWFAAGLLFGLAISTKLNFAPLAAAAGLYVLTSGGRCGIRAAAWLAAGGIAGLLPMLGIWLLAPDSFFYGVLTFASTGPFAWYSANGQGDELTLAGKAGDMLKALASGPALVALLLLTVNWITNRAQVRSPGRRLAVWMVVGGLFGAALPTPTQLQYVMPLLPPLGLALGYMLDDARHWTRARRETAIGLLCLMALAGLWPTSHAIAAMAREGSPVWSSTQAAYWAARKVRALTGDDEIITLAPHRIIDGGLALDPRLATGPFAYRSGWTISPAEARAIKALTPATLTDLDRAPPEAILVGYENGTRNLPLRPDDSLIAYARRNAYRMIRMPDGIGRLYVKVRTATRELGRPRRMAR